MKKRRMRRVSVSLPVAMVESFKATAELSGVSVSRLIFLRLRRKSGDLVVPSKELLEEIRTLTQAVHKLSREKTLPSDVVSSIKRLADFYQGFAKGGA